MTDRPVEPLGPAAAARLALDAVAAGRAVAVVALVEAPPGRASGAGARIVVSEGGETTGSLGIAELDARARRLAERVLGRGGAAREEAELAAGRFVLYAEAQRPAPSLVIVGAGHIAVPLAQLGALLGFRVTVLDDREDFATGVRFPKAAAVHRVDFADPFRDVRLSTDTYLVLVTRGHRYDFDILSRLVRGDARPRYIGLIGSRRRIRAAFGALLDAGVERRRLAEVHAPVGLDLGAETPEEIAVAIAAELVLVRRGGGGRDATLTARERVLERLLPTGDEEEDG